MSDEQQYLRATEIRELETTIAALTKERDELRKSYDFLYEVWNDRCVEIRELQKERDALREKVDKWKMMHDNTLNDLAELAYETRDLREKVEKVRDYMARHKNYLPIIFDDIKQILEGE